MQNIKYISDYLSIERNAKQYIQIGDSKNIAEGKSIQLIFADDIDLQVAIFRINSILYAVSNICPHRHAREIYKGIIDGLNVVCPLHGWTYNIQTGMNTNPKQGQRNLIKYDIFEENTKVYLQKPELIIPKWRDAIEL